MVLETLKREVAPPFRARAAQAKKRKLAQSSLKKNQRVKSSSAAAAATVSKSELDIDESPNIMTEVKIMHFEHNLDSAL